MKRVLVTGAAGFIGRQSLSKLIDCGFEVTAVTTQAPINSNPAVKWVRADLMDPLQVSRVFAEVRPTHLLHFAWYAEHGKFWSAPENFRWVQASLKLLEAFAQNGGRRVVTAGTCAEYDWKYGYCVENQTPLDPHTVYGTCKAALGALQAAYCRQTGISSAWGRIFLLYGPYEHPNRLVSSVILSLLRGETARCSHGRQVRDFMHVEDVASAFVALLASSVEGAVNIASARPVALRDVVGAIAQCLSRDDAVDFGAVAAVNDPQLLLADNRRLSEEVGWSPSYDLDSGLNSAIRWWKQCEQARTATT